MRKERRKRANALCGWSLFVFTSFLAVSPTRGQSRDFAGIDSYIGQRMRTMGEAAYGMGWNIGRATDGGTTWRHSGDGSDFHANIVVLPEKRLGFVLLLNANSAAWIAGDENNAIANGVTQLLLGRTPEPPAFNPFSLLVIASVAIPSLLVVARLVFLIRAGRREVPVAPRRLAWGFPGDALTLLFYVFGLPLVYQLPLPEVALFLPDAFLFHCLGAILTIAGTLYRLGLLRRRPADAMAG